MPDRIADCFPKGSYVTNDSADWQNRVEGRIRATTEKFGGRVKVGDDWHPTTTLRVVLENDRSLDCDGFCGGTGVFRGGGRVENGRYIGFEGPCFRCEGTGKQTPKDRNRNRTYDNHYRRIAP